MLKGRRRFGLIAMSILLPASALVGVSTVPALAAASSSSAQSAAPATPDIKINQLCSGTSQARSWVNIDIITMTGLEDWCFGYTGTWTFTQPNSTITAFCSGTNHGTMVYRKSPNGSKIILNFPSGYNLTGLEWYPVSLEIKGWTGSYKCPVS